MDNRMQAFCDDFDKISIYMSKEYYMGESKEFYVSDLCGNHIQLDIEHVEDIGNYKVYKCKLNNNIINIGREYSVFEEHALSVPLQFRYIVKTEKFNKLFFSDRDDFGAIVDRDVTKFVLWAPTANDVSLILNPYGLKEIHPMVRAQNGVWEISIPRNLHLANYLYLVNVNGKVVETIDPYGRSSIANHKASSVIDYKYIDVDFKDEKLAEFKSYTDAIIFETSVRDFSSDWNTTIKNKGKFLGMIEKEATTIGEHKVGFDYFKSLGATHIQIMPVNDFSSTDELFPNRFYNWGYDPVQYNTLEGAYSSSPNDSLSRVVEFSKVISAFHSAGIRVNIDVVYNHMFDIAQSSFDKIVPYYYFRSDLNGNLSNGSFCGNDIDTKIPMARKFIIDSLIHIIKDYHVDGFRFDLMGIIDLETMLEVCKKLKAIKADIMIYGEGWNMPTMLDNSEKTIIENANLLPDIAFFNDYYRDNVKGPTASDRKMVRGYSLGDGNYRDAFKAALVANTQGEFGSKMFDFPSQSISYVEAHDNMTLWDKINVACKDESLELKIKRQKFTNATVALSQGISFYHMGQEFCRTKNGEDNSYRSSDSVNMIDYNRMVEFKEVVDYTRDVIKLRRTIPVFNFTSTYQISSKVYFDDLDNGRVLMRIKNISNITEYEEILVYFNPFNSSAKYKLDADYTLILDDKGLTNKTINEIDLKPVSIMVAARAKRRV